MQIWLRGTIPFRSKQVAVLLGAGLLCLSGRSLAGDSRVHGQAESVGKLLAQVDAATRALSRAAHPKGPVRAGVTAEAPSEVSSADIHDLCDRWIHQRVVLTPEFIKAFPQFGGDLNDKADAVERQASGPLAAADVARLAASLKDYRQRLAELADATDASSALVVSGGVSLGSYQGGFLQYYTQFLLAQGDAVQRTYGLAAIADGSGIRVATGASAGSINAFIASLARCRAPVYDPRLSLFWSAWMPVGFDNLVDLDKVTFDGVLSSEPLEEAITRLKVLWTQSQNLSGWTTACDAVLGFSATRLRARDIDFSRDAQSGSDALRLKRQTEKFVLHLVGKPTEAPRMGPFRPPGGTADDGPAPVEMVYPTLGQSALGVEGSLENLTNSIEQVANLLKASAAFPLAFSPVSVDMTVWQHAEGRDAYVPLEHGSVRFVDGGVLDNTPIGLAIKIEDWLRQQRLPVPQQLVFLSSDAVGWMRTSSAATQQPAPHSLFDTYSPFLGDFITTAEQTELLNTLENQSSIPHNVPARMMPIAGEQLTHFFAFAEQDFRAFDFFMGMVDAREYLASEHRLAVQVVSAAKGVSATAEDARPLRVDAPEFACFDEHRRQLRAGALPNIKAIGACASVSSNLLALLQASTELRMRAQMAGPKGPQLTIDDFLQAIDKYGYKYRQLKYRGKLATANTAVLALRGTGQSLINELGWQQPLLEDYPVQLAGKAAANSLEYLAPRWILSVGGLVTGGGEVGVTWQGTPWERRPWRRFSFGLSAFGRLLRWENRALVQDGMLTDPVAVTWALNFGPQIEYAVGPRLQLDLLGGLELDYVSAREFWHPYYNQVGWFAQANAVLYQRLYLFFSIYGLPHDSRSDQDLATLGLTRSSCCDFRAGFGLRFFGH
jgi:predicted acylesterase/phospholipase RssA